MGILVIGLTGCEETEEKKEDTKVKEQTLVCTTSEFEDGIDMEQVISMTYKDDKFTNMKIEVNSTINNADITDNWEEYKKEMNKNNEEFEKEGISLKVDVDDTKFKYNVILDIDVDKVSEGNLKEQGFEGLKEDDSTIEENKKAQEDDCATCVIK